MTIREIITSYNDKFKDASNLNLEEASKALVELSALFSNLNTTLVERQMAYNEVKMKKMEEVKSVAKAEVIAQTTQEYRELMEIKGYLEATKELTRSIKYYLRSMGDEYQMSHNL